MVLEITNQTVITVLFGANVGLLVWIGKRVIADQRDHATRLRNLENTVTKLDTIISERDRD